MQTIKILVLRPFKADFKEVYRNSIEWSMDIQFPFDSIYSTLMLLYPSCIVEFHVMPNRL